MTLRILYLIETLGHGGAEHQLVANLRRIDRRRFQPIVGYFRKPDYLAGELAAANVELHWLNVPQGMQHWPELALRIRSLARDTRADLIHTNLFEADIVGGLAGRLARVPVVSTLCNIAGERVRMTDNPHYDIFKFTLANWMWGGALRRWHRRSIAISEAVLKSTAETFGVDPARLTVVYRGIDENRARPLVDKREVRARIGLAEAEPFLLAVGRLAPQKGHKYLVAALPEILRSYPKTMLAIVGEGWLGTQLMEQAKALGVQDHVILLGKRRDVPELMAACDVFVFPSLFEGLGVSLLEASFMGCACVSTATGPIPEIITDGATGLLVTPADSRALAQALLRLAGDPALRARLGDAAYENVKARFMLADKVASLERWYAQLLPRNAAEA